MCDDKDEATVFHFFIIRDLKVDVELKPETRKEIRNIQKWDDNVILHTQMLMTIH